LVVLLGGRYRALLDGTIGLILTAGLHFAFFSELGHIVPPAGTRNLLVLGELKKESLMSVFTNPNRTPMHTFPPDSRAIGGRGAHEGPSGDVYKVVAGDQPAFSRDARYHALWACTTATRRRLKP
jgi:hypothetical protein